jgi:14-3-3 protein epsilon
MTSLEMKFFLSRVADQVERYTDVIKFINEIIAEDSVLSADARKLLSIAYKVLTGAQRNALRTISAFLDDETVKAIPERVSKLTELRDRLVTELNDYCNELIELTNSKLLTDSADAKTKVFYEKLKADYYRYSIEFETDAMRDAGSEKAKESYERAIATDELRSADPAYLGLALNYSIFLYEILGKKKEAIELADKTFKRGVELTNDPPDESEYSEATLILQLLKDNVELWNEEAEA